MEEKRNPDPMHDSKTPSGPQSWSRGDRQGANIDRIMKMTNYMVMISANVFEVKAKLSEYLARVEGGEVVVICRRNVPIAELRAVPAPVHGDRPRGLAKGTFKVPASFFESLPDVVLDGFHGDAG